jgi:5-methylcytosine-specific restriction endonuclease McrA
LRVVDRGTGFAERFLALLDQASVATTYKYALLLALIDSCLDGTDPAGNPPERIAVRHLAEQVLAQYWTHTDPYPGTGDVLRQSGVGQAELLTQIRRFRGADPAGRSTLSAARYSAGYERLVAAASWKLAEMPLPRLQRVGNTVDPFLYEIGWDETITRRQFEGASFDRSVHLLPGVAPELVRLAPLLRLLVERLWASRVIVYNRLPEGRLDEFLFRRARLDAVRVRLSLFELQDGRCFYTGRQLRPAQADVDHFVPWSRSPLNAIENLVVADRRINNDKRDHLAGAEHVARWRCRNDGVAADLVTIARANRWDSAPAQTIGVARALYFALGETNLLWAGPGRFVPTDVPRLRTVLGA